LKQKLISVPRLIQSEKISNGNHISFTYRGGSHC
jgi:hypothetical protein